MAYAEYLAGMAFNNAGVGLVHAMAHQLGGYYNLPHGLCNAILLPAVMDFNLPVAAEKYAAVARATMIDVSGFSDLKCGQLVIAMIRQLNELLAIPAKLSELKGFQADDIPHLAENALKDICYLTNPVAATKEEIEQIYRSII
jgi:alcohol dehydrogenase